LEYSERKKRYCGVLPLGELVDKKNNPGPGEYNPLESKVKRSPAWKMNKQNNDKRREDDKQQTPGPGNYETTPSHIRK